MCVPGISPPGPQQPPVARLKHISPHLVHTFRCVLSGMASSLQTLCLVDVGQRSFLRMTNMLDLIPRLLTYLRRWTLSTAMLAGAWQFLPLMFLSNFVGLSYLENTVILSLNLTVKCSPGSSTRHDLQANPK